MTVAGDSLSQDVRHSVDNRCDSRFPETVNLGGLIAGFGAWDLHPRRERIGDLRIANADRIASIAEFDGGIPSPG